MKKELPSGIAPDAYNMNQQLKSQNQLQLSQRNADKASLLQEIEFLQTAANNVDSKKLSDDDIQLLQLQSIINTPNDEMNLQEQESLKFDFLEHFKQLGNSIMNLFKTSKSKGNDAKSAEAATEDDDEGSITIEDSQGNDKKKQQQ